MKNDTNKRISSQNQKLLRNAKWINECKFIPVVSMLIILTDCVRLECVKSIYIWRSWKQVWFQISMFVIWHWNLMRNEQFTCCPFKNTGHPPIWQIFHELPLKQAYNIIHKGTFVYFNPWVVLFQCSFVQHPIGKSYHTLHTLWFFTGLLFGFPIHPGCVSYQVIEGHSNVIQHHLYSGLCTLWKIFVVYY